jgi:ubiquitin-protein ligase
MKHIASFQTSETHPGVYYAFDEADVTKGSVLITGPRYPGQPLSELRSAKYPYEECLFFFNIDYPAAYPAVSPHMEFLNSAIGDNIRFHPNLYQRFGDRASSGKVCLSILGTWAGPGWNPTMNIESTLMTVQSLLGPDPIQNEPGFERLKEDDPRLVSYNRSVLYHSINFTLNVFLMILHKDPATLPPPIPDFVDEIKERMWYSLNFLIVKLKRTIDQIGAIVETSQEIHHPATTYTFGLLLDKAIEMYRNFPADLKTEYAPGDPSINGNANAIEAAEVAAPRRNNRAAAQRNANNSSNNGNGNGNGNGEQEYYYSNDD